MGVLQSLRVEVNHSKLPVRMVSHIILPVPALHLLVSPTPPQAQGHMSRVEEIRLRTAECSLQIQQRMCAINTCDFGDVASHGVSRFQVDKPDWK